MWKLLVIIAAVVAAMAPTPALFVEREYSRGAYAAIQQQLTPITNGWTHAFLDPLALIIGAALLLRWTLKVAGSRRGGRVRAAAAVAAEMAATAGVLYLLFLAVWGLNYRRLPLTDQLSYDAERITGAALGSLGATAVSELNRLHAAAHARGWPALDAAHGFQIVDRYGSGFDRALGRLGSPATIVPGVPKRSLLNWYFQRAGIDGMTNPYVLEIIVNDTILPFERPFVVAHEWAHLAGYADEAEASFVGWLACLAGDEGAQYSGWLFLYPHLLGHLDEGARGSLRLQLSEGVRADLTAVSERLRRSVPAVRQTAERVYDRFLKVNRVAEGVESYDRVVVLVLGTRFGPGWVPVLR
jgi:hypothetical protein